MAQNLATAIGLPVTHREVPLDYVRTSADLAAMLPIDTVLTDGWADRPAPGLLTLTPGGRRRLTDVAARVDAFRELSMAGISLEEYRTTVRTLERMSHKLEMATSPSH
ncbi:hypothetical protein ACF08B_38610 [Streptomyces sp. NPDC015139]|uniref:hypothetical protein n=1 Tax=Streptomyces sp. NPDC015139 TaxID=3364942 RepID=UPI0036F9B97A